MRGYGLIPTTKWMTLIAGIFLVSKAGSTLMPPAPSASAKSWISFSVSGELAVSECGRMKLY